MIQGVHMIVSKATSAFSLLGFLLIVCHSQNELPLGHLQKLGSHQKPLGVTMIGKFSRPNVFFSSFVEPGVPLLMRGVLEFANHPGLINWTDDYLREHFGNELVNIENNKKENRQGRHSTLSLRQFLNLYQTENMYLVHSLTGKMAELVLVPECLQCGGFQRVIQEAVLWLANGNTASVLHYDGLDNLICLLDGRKDVVLIDKALKPLVEAVDFNEEGGYIDLDVDSVDMNKFNHLQSIQWHTASLLKGDCLFIPKGWYHQVRSSGPRHLAVNLWLSHLWWFNSSDCPDGDTFKPLRSIHDFGFASPNEVYRSKFLEMLQSNTEDFIDRDHLISAITTTTKERAAQFLDAIDDPIDSYLITMNDYYNFDIDLAVIKFPDVFGLPHNPVEGEEKEKIILYKRKQRTDSLDKEQSDSEVENSGGKIKGTESDDVVIDERTSTTESFVNNIETESISVDPERTADGFWVSDEQIDEVQVTSDDSSVSEREDSPSKSTSVKEEL